MISVEICGWKFALSVKNEEIKRAISDKFYPYVNHSEGNVISNLFIYEQDNEIRILDKKRELITVSTFDSNFLSYKYIIDIIRDNIVVDDGSNILHGSAVDFKGYCYVFLGESHAGKSTLSAFLNSIDGVDCISDDLVYIENLDVCAKPMSKYINLRENSLNILNEVYKLDVKYKFDNFLDRYKININTDNKIKKRKIEKIFILNRKDRVDFSIKKLNNGLSYLLDNMYFPYQVKKNIQTAIKIIQEKELLLMNYHDLNDVLEYLTTLW